MILLHNSKELNAHKDSIPTTIFDFLCQQFALLEDDDPQMNVYGNYEFICTAGTIGVVYSQEEMQELEILDEMMILDDVKLFLCQEGTQFLDVVLVGRHD